MPTVLHDIAWRAMQVHGALGVTDDVPFMSMVTGAAVMGLADGPTEVHKATVAKQVLRDYQPSDDIWPTGGYRANAKRHRRSTPNISSTRWATCERRDRHRAARGLDGRRRPAREG